jgi:hypothetical protein
MILASNKNAEFTVGFQCHLYFISSGLVAQSEMTLVSSLEQSSIGHRGWCNSLRGKGVMQNRHV